MGKSGSMENLRKVNSACLKEYETLHSFFMSNTHKRHSIRNNNILMY